MRVATFNILHGRSPVDGAVDVDRFAQAVADLDADVLALQEVDRDQPRSHGADLAAVAAEAVGAGAHRFAATMAGEPGRGWRPARGDEPPGTPAYGVALVSRLPVRDWRVVRLPRLGLPVPVWFRGRPAPVVVVDEPRAALVATLDRPDGPVTVAATHLSFLPGWNVLQLRRLVGALTGAPRVVLLGDLNLTTCPATRTSRMRSVASGATFPADRPRQQLDHVLVRGLSQPATEGRPVHLPLSDHRALVVDLAER